MVNTVEFAERLKLIMEHYGLNAASFAEAISVNRSSISHLLSGRNKPSLDFVIKIIEQFDEVELYWLLNGKGVFPKGAETDKLAKGSISSLKAENPSEDKNVASTPSIGTSDSEIEQIIVYLTSNHTGCNSK